jgi:uncharacterized protein YydD (DUF2326 family)
MKLLKLYSEPEIFTPIVFETGVNIILGEKVDNQTISNRKTNGVGKSVCIEMIQFCLMKTFDKSNRIFRIPKTILPPSTAIKLDLQLHQHRLTISRTPENAARPTIIWNGEQIDCNNIADALLFLTELFYNDKNTLSKPSFRALLGPIIREERSEFKDIIRCYDTKELIHPNLLYPTHLYFLGLDLDLYENIKKTIEAIDKKIKYIKDLKNQLTENNTKKLSDIKANLNELKEEVSKIKDAIESLKSNVAFEALQKEIVSVEIELDKLRIRQKIVRSEIAKIQSLPKVEEITENDIEIIYNQFKEGLGNLIAKSIEQVKTFKSKIDQFQQTLINNKLKILTTDLEAIRSRIIVLERQHVDKINLIDTSGVLKDLNTSLSVYDQKNEVLSRIRTLMSDYENAEREKQVLEQKKGDLLLQLNTLLFRMQAFQESFQETILKIHERIMGNRKAAFMILTQQKTKTSIEFEMRVDADGSHSVDRIKVFIYDMALMFNEFTQKRHPKFLIHDNIFDVDQDTLIQSLHFLLKQEDLYDDFQYILTLNKDKIENELKNNQISLVDRHFKAIFTKSKKFLKQDYQEI